MLFEYAKIDIASESAKGSAGRMASTMKKNLFNFLFTTHRDLITKINSLQQNRLNLTCYN